MLAAFAFVRWIRPLEPGYKASAQATSLVRDRAREIQLRFDALPRGADARTRIDPAQALVSENNRQDGQDVTGNEWARVFGTDAGASTSSISFALDAIGTEPNILDGGNMEVHLRLCLRLTWSTTGGSSLGDTACPAPLRPEHSGGPDAPWVDNVIHLNG